MTKLVVRRGVVEDAASLSPRLRPEDALELRLSSGPDVEATIRESIQNSHECFAGELDGLVIAVGGVVLTEDGMGIPWLVGSPEMLHYPITLVSVGRAAVSRWGKLCRVLSNVTHAANTVHHRWLRHIGFTFVPQSVPVGDTKAPFLLFYRHSPNV